MPPFTRDQQRARYAPRHQAAPAPRIVSSVKPSAYQQAIREWLLTGTGNAIVSAKAGSGKTSTLCMLSDDIPTVGTRAAFLAFNKSIAEELARRLPAHVQAATFHSVCNGALRRHPVAGKAAAAAGRNWVQKNKVHGILDSLSAQNMHVETLRQDVVKLVGLMKANAMLPDVDETDLSDLIDRYELEFDSGRLVDEGIKLAREVLVINNTDLSTIDFDDMLYLCAIMDAPMMRYSHLFVDEAQDTNKVQRVLMHRMLSADSRLIAVGDESQAIYGFRGADSNAMPEIAREFQCTRFPLSISYRCPASVIALAQSIVPDIEARDNAPEGTVSTLDGFELADFTALDLVVCRNTAPLISLAFKFLRAHKPVKVMGREIGEQLIALLQKMRAASLEDLAERLDTYTSREVEKALSKRQETKAERLTDQHDSIMAIIEGLPETDRTVFAVIDVIRRLFTDEGNHGRTTLATVHKAKGMEAHRVFILDPHLMPSKWAKQPWQQVQEQNLRYVAITRSLDTLHFVDSQVIR